MGYQTKYQMIKINEIARMDMLRKRGIEEYRVTNPSRKAAVNRIGTIPIITFKPSLPPCISECSRLCVPGNRMLLPMINPAAPDSMMDEISSVPCIHITSTEAQPRFLAKK